jgi:hypothetical protein
MRRLELNKVSLFKARDHQRKVKVAERVEEQDLLLAVVLYV